MKHTIKTTNVVQFERNAEFYFDLGYKYINKGNLKVALRYIEKAARLKPSDSFIQFNYAGILAELGDINRSTDILLNIVNSLEPNYSECYFGLGCNYLQMQKIKKAIEYFNTYIEIDPEGEFAEEAEDLLEMLTMIKEANNNLDDEELDQIYKIEEDAINYLENREYKKAVEQFEIVVEKLPNAVPARNNLSLTYYYLGKIDSAIELAKEVLTYEPDNVHANCNLGIFYSKLNMNDWMEKKVRDIKKLNTDNAEYLYKIADTLGCLGKHNDAYNTYKKLIAIEPNNSSYIHYAAVAAYNKCDFDVSIKLWEKMKKLDPNNYLSDYYINKVRNVMEGKEKFEEFIYIYQLPKEEINRRIELIYKFLSMSDEDFKNILNNTEEYSTDEFKQLLGFGINFDIDFVRKLIFNKIKVGNIKDMESLIKNFLLKEGNDIKIITETIFLLDIIGAREPYKVNFDGVIQDVRLEQGRFKELDWNNEWDDVLKKTLSMMNLNYHESYSREVQDIWFTFIKYMYPEVPRISNVNIWAGALEYTYCRLYMKKTTQNNIAEKYSISKTAFIDKYKIIYGVIENILNKKK